jgi:hypothetical protein
VVSFRRLLILAPVSGMARDAADALMLGFTVGLGI